MIRRASEVVVAVVHAEVEFLSRVGSSFGGGGRAAEAVRADQFL